MKKNLFPYYRVFVCWAVLVPALLLLLLVGGAVIWYHMGARDVPVEEYREAAFIVIFVIMFLYTGISTVLFRGNVIRFRCPHCGERSVRIEYDPPPVLITPEWKTQNTIAECQSCGFQQQTDLQMKSNMFIKFFPVKVKSDQGE
ncbi:MAG: hypothetical protein V8Q16_10760 [Akkermansia muciniphila]|nr:hypothetical protein [Akkermansia sp.]MCD8320880.1 hypothetical protein [Akkermansia sp.]